jgi:hypothetical protein
MTQISLYASRRGLSGQFVVSVLKKTDEGTRDLLGFIELNEPESYDEILKPYGMSCSSSQIINFHNFLGQKSRSGPMEITQL